MFTRPAIGQLILPPHLLLSAEVTQHHDAVWGFFNHTFSSYSVAPQFPATKGG